MACVAEMMETDEIELIPLTPRKARPAMVYFSSAAAWLSAMAFGCVLGYSAPAVPSIRNSMNNPLHLITKEQESWFNGLLALGALLGGVCSGWSTERLGRKATIILFSVPFVAGWILIGYANSIPQLFIGRFMTGLCTGVASLTVPVYVAETVPAKLRGLLGSCVQLSVTVGVMAVYFLGLYLPWSWLALACSLPPLFSMGLMLLCPETPRWLVAHKRQTEAIRALRFLNGSEVNAEAECQAIEVGLLHQATGKLSLSEVRLPQVWKPLLLSLGLMLFQQANGNNNVIQNAQNIFQGSKGFLDPGWSSVVIGVFMVIATLIGSILMDRLGRKILLLFSGFFNFVSLAALGLYYYLVEEVNADYSDSLAWLPLVSVTVFIVVFSVGYGPIPWLMMGELFPLRIRGFASGFATAFNWTCVFIITKEFQDTLVVFRNYGTYWFYAATSLISCFFVFFCLPETKGKSLEEIEASFREPKPLKDVVSVRL